jgi:hypothetical protein
MPQKGKTHILRKFNNTMKKVNSVAIPSLTMASVAQPEFAPIFAGLGAGLQLTGVGASAADSRFK